jgi:esterase FrsA
LADGQREAALQAFNFGRFPFVDGEARRDAHRRCVSLFESWILARRPEIQRRSVPFAGTEFPVYVSGSPGPKRPLLLVIGGIVSIKEQWYRSLLDGTKLGFAVCVAEFPGVGENPLSYTPENAAYIGAIIDALCGHERDVAVYCVAISFSGHLALLHAGVDPRIRGLILSGTPAHSFFRSADWWHQIPGTTLATLAHLTGEPVEDLPAKLQRYALTAEQLGAVSVPVRHITAQRDEIVPAADAAFLLQHLQHAEELRLDDIHGAPHCMQLIKKYIPYSLLVLSGRSKGLFGWLLRLAVAHELRKLTRTRNGRVTRRLPGTLELEKT